MEQLVYTLLAYLNSSIVEDMNYYIAKQFLENIYKIKDFSLEDIAFEFNVSSRTINRFCNRIGYHNFTTLKKNMLYTIPESENQYYLTTHFQTILSHHFGTIDKIEFSTYQELIKMIYSANNIWVIGFEKHQVLALEFQKRLFQFGKISKCIMNYHQQLIDIEKASNNDLIIAISLNGYALNDYNQKLKNILSKKVLLTFNHLLTNDFFDKTITCGDIKYAQFSEYALLRFFDILFYHYKQMLKTGQI